MAHGPRNPHPHEEMLQSQTRIIPLQDFELRIHDDQVEIVKNGDQYDMLNAYPDHPYCEKAEIYFHDAMQKGRTHFAHNAKLRIYPKQKVAIYLRNRRTFLVEVAIVEADVALKTVNVRSGMTIDPPELGGLICCPPKNPGDPWIAARAYDRQYLAPRYSESRMQLRPPDVVTKHIKRMPHIRPEKNHAAGLTEAEERNIDFQSLPPNIILAEKELRHYFTHATFFVDTETSPRYMGQVLTFSETPDPLEGTYYVVSKSPFAWRRLENNEFDFDISKRDDSGKGYFELVRGRIEPRGETTGRKAKKIIEFIPEQQPSKEGLLDNATVYKLRPNQASIVRDTRALVQSGITTHK